MYRYLAIANYEDVLSSRRAIGKWRAMPSQNATLRFYLWRRLSRLGQQIQPVHSSRIDAINITEVRDKAEGENADPQSDRPVDGVSGRAVVGCKEDALALIRRDAPMLTDFTTTCLTRRCWINRPNGAKCLPWTYHIAAAVRTCSCRVPRSGQAMVDLLAEYEKVGLQLDFGNCPIIYRCIWSI